MDQSLFRLVLFQFILVSITYVIFLVIYGVIPAVSVWFGGLITAVNVLLLARCARRKTVPGLDAAQQTLLVFYSCAVTRFVAVAGLFVLGMGVLNLYPLAVLMGFVSGQLVLFFPQTRKLIAN